jgi:hypothetical protein
MPAYKFPCFSGSVAETKAASAQKNVQLQFMIVAKDPGIVAQAGGTLFKCRIADSSGEMSAIFYDDVGLALKVGDVIQLKEGAVTASPPARPALYFSFKRSSRRALRIYNDVHSHG